MLINLIVILHKNWDHLISADIFEWDQFQYFYVEAKVQNWKYNQGMTIPLTCVSKHESIRHLSYLL